jgi:hypothetical protein
MMTMDEAPPNTLSLDRKSFFQDVAKCDKRSWKSLLSIVISAIATDGMEATTQRGDDDDKVRRRNGRSSLVRERKRGVALMGLGERSGYHVIGSDAPVSGADSITCLTDGIAHC